MRPLRAILFIALGLSAGLPFVYFFNPGENNKQYLSSSIDVYPWALGGAFYIGGALTYTFRMPERWFPKKFDIVGSSHNIFHTMCLIAFTI